MSTRTTPWALAGLIIGWLSSSCSTPSAFQCESDGQCQLDGQLGQCSEGYCAFEDPECDSGWAYGEFAGGGLAGTCVPIGDGTGTTGSTTSTTSTSTSTSTTGPADSSGVMTQCPPGASCIPTDPCAVEGICDPGGDCVAVDFVQCEVPGQCWAPPGQCIDGVCEFTPQSRNFPCDDGDPCTQGDFCDGNGGCAPGSMCASGDSCLIGTCTPEGCEYEQLPDGEPCGENSADRCCDGTCVDISSDEDHCGGCYTSCSEGTNCESLEETPMCPFDEPGISGRCTCESPNDCPMGQGCTIEDPYPGRCEPLTDDDCHGVSQNDMGVCPAFCTY